MPRVTKAVIPAAGYGTRVLPATKVLPKEMFPIVDKPAIQYIVEEAVASGITDILIVTNRGKNIIEMHYSIPLFKEGCLVTVLGLIGLLFYPRLMKKFCLSL